MAGVQRLKDRGRLVGGQAVEMQMLMPVTVASGKDRTVGQQRGEQVGKRLPQDQRISSRQAGRGR